MQCCQEEPEKRKSSRILLNLTLPFLFTVLSNVTSSATYGTYNCVCNDCLTFCYLTKLPVTQHKQLSCKKSVCMQGKKNLKEHL